MQMRYSGHDMLIIVIFEHGYCSVADPLLSWQIYRTTGVVYAAESKG